MKVILIDDEKAMHLILKRMLAKMKDVEVVGSYMETESAYAYLMSHEVDLVFVDISMPRENGLAFAERLRDSGRRTKLVFITSHKEYALDAFDVFAFDYMVKPVVQERLLKTVQRALAEDISTHPREVEREPAADEVSFICLGGIDIQSNKGRRAKWKSSKSSELFGYLLLHKGRLVTRARLIEDLFGDMPQKNAEIYLNTTVYQLRKVLSTFGLKESLYSDSNHYALSLNEAQVDLLDFEDGCKRLASIEESQIEQAIELERLYAGELFGERAFPWAWSEVERVSLLYVALAQRLCAALLHKGEAHAAVHLSTKLMARNELDEKSFLLLMQALAQQENKEALAGRYRRYAETLQQELGTKPSQEVEDLYRRLLLAGLRVNE